MKTLQLLILFCISNNIYSQISEANFIGIESEFLTPIHENRNINTVNLNFIYKPHSTIKKYLEIGFGINTTYAFGDIIQLNQNLEELTLKNKAFGIGPFSQFESQLFVIKSFSAKPYLAFGINIYSNKFPAGGDIYNFMLRGGIVFNFKLNSSYNFKFTPKFMHVSNGQGLIPQNPSYESLGIGITIEKKLQF